MSRGQPPGERGEVRFGNTTLAYRVVRSAKRKKTVTLSVSADGLEVRVPEGVDGTRVQSIVLEKAGWIVRKQVHLERLLRNAQPPRRFVDGESFQYLGRQYRLKRLPEATSVKLKGRYFTVPQASEAVIREALIAWYKVRAEDYLVKRVELYRKRLGQAPSKVLIRDQRKRWGSCNAKGELRFNWRIVMASVVLVDYVVAHELCHLKHMDHSSDFWDELRRILPDYKARQLRLEREGKMFELD